MTVKQKQLLLAWFDLLAVEDVDGIWGALSAQATAKLQIMLGIPDDGVWGDQTDAAVRERIYSGEDLTEESIAADINVGDNEAAGWWDEIEFFSREEFRCQCGGKYCDGFPAEPQEKHSVVNNLANLPTDGDLYCFEGGINDFWNDVPIGTVTSGYTGTVDNTTLCGAMETIFRYAQNNFVGKPICFVIVHKISNTATAKNNNGVTFTDFHDAMIKVCEKYSIPYYDAFMHSGLNVNVEAHKTNYCPDLVHPNDEGHKRYYVPQLLVLFREIMPII